MDAPLYPPAAAFEQPRFLPPVLSTRNSSIAELLADPEAKPILAAAFPGMLERLGTGGLAAQLEALSLTSLLSFGGIKADALDRIEGEFAKINARRGVVR